jgi:4-diphosphocytidyl-2-C-methyl-D-erythritol kinase
VKRIAMQAPAKINLGLVVLGKRPDGYHEIETVMQMVSLCDTLEIEQSDGGIVLASDSSELPLGRENLVYRAAERLAREAGRTPAVRIRLEKRIPVAAGLGGGSSDAAATLTGLNRLWGLDYPPEKLRALAEELGMDVPFFLFSPTALARGRGERLSPLTPPKPPLWMVLVNPRFRVSTPWAYESLNLGLTTKNKHISMRRFSITTFEDARFPLENDLEGATLEAFPVLREIKESLRELGALAGLMSGSGPTVYGVFPNRQTAASARQVLQRRRELATYLVHTLDALPVPSSKTERF